MDVRALEKREELRAKLAGQLACGMMAADVDGEWLNDSRQLAVNAVAIADEMLAALDGELTQEQLDAESSGPGDDYEPTF